MFKWTAESLKAWHPVLNKETEDNESNYSPVSVIFVRRLLQQTKQLSQMIAKSWVEDDKVGQEIRRILLNLDGKDSAAHYSDLEELLSGKKLLVPQIFTEQELKTYRFKIDRNSFEGELTENTEAIINGKPPYFIIVLPYPPKPNEFDQFLNQSSKLQDWIDSPILCDDKGNVQDPFPPFPYVPMTTC